MVPGADLIQKFHSYPVARESPAMFLTPRDNDTVTHSPAENKPDGMNRILVFPLSMRNWPDILPDHLPHTETVAELMDSGSMAESKFTANSADRVAVSDCGIGETDVIADAPSAEALAMHRTMMVVVTPMNRMSSSHEFQ
jgi:hypothetical protein